MALSSEGDIVYITENVTQQLGLHHVDMIGQSIYDFSHPCDHEELRDALGLRTDGSLGRSFFLRLKSSLTVKGKSHNMKAASFKVMNCSGRIVRAINHEKSQFDDDDSLVQQYKDFDTPEEHFLILIADPIPHPSGSEIPIDGSTFVTKHSLDMKFTYVDEKIVEFLGYSADDLIGRSAYEFHHVLDHDAIMKSYKTMFTKGQTQTTPYRFMSRLGGYAWMQTQATVIYGARESKPQSIVCFHSCLSEVEDEDTPLCSMQTEAIKHVSTKPIVPAVQSQPITSKLFFPKTVGMDSGFLAYDDAKCTVLKEEPDDLTYLAPIAGDSCIPLDLPSVSFSADLFDSVVLTPEMLDCIPLTAFDFPILPDLDSIPVLDADEPSLKTESTDNDIPESPEATDPCLYLNFRTAPGSRSSVETPFSPSSEEGKYTSDEMCPSPESMPRSVERTLSDDDEEMKIRAPFIPMSDDEELSVFDPAQLFSDLDLDHLSVSPVKPSTLVELLQSTEPPKQAKQNELEYQRPMIPYHAFKRGSVDPPDPDESDTPVKRMRNNNMFALPYTYSPAARSPKPSRGASLGLLELLTEKAVGQVLPNSVLQNLLDNDAPSSVRQPKRPFGELSSVDLQDVQQQLISESSFELSTFELTDTVSMDTNDFFNAIK